MSLQYLSRSTELDVIYETEPRPGRMDNVLGCSIYPRLENWKLNIRQQCTTRERGLEGPEDTHL
jgi:hypothetical protein